MQKDHSAALRCGGSNIGSNLQKRDRAARDEDGFVFLAPASAPAVPVAVAHTLQECVGLTIQGVPDLRERELPA